MKPLFDETRALALRVAGDARSSLQDHLRGAATAVGTAVNPVVLRDGGRKAVAVVRRNPVATAAAMATVIGAGVAVWVFRRVRRRALDERLNQNEDMIELKPVRPRIQARKARKTVRAATT